MKEDYEVLEIELNDEEIDRLVEELIKLKEKKGHFHFDLNDNKELLVHHEEDELK